MDKSAEMSVQEEVAVPCAESEEVIGNSGVMTQENAVQPKKNQDKFIGEKDKEVYIEKAQFDHNNKINQMEKESELRIKESIYKALVIPYQKRVVELAILLPQSENPNQIMHEISVYLKLFPLIQMDGVLEMAKSLGIDNPTPNQKSVIKEVL